MEALKKAGKKASPKYSVEVRERAVRLFFEHQHEYESQRAALNLIASKIGCTAETLRSWVKQAQQDKGIRPGMTSQEQQRIRDLERENRELWQVNEILRKASAYFAQAELERRVKP
jgi:transposase